MSDCLPSVHRTDTQDVHILIPRLDDAQDERPEGDQASTTRQSTNQTPTIVLRMAKWLITIQGIYQILILDESQPEGGPMSQWSSKIVCEGGSSDPLIVPSHWHKVCMA